MTYPREQFRRYRGRRRCFSAMNSNFQRGYNNNRFQGNYDDVFMNYNRPRKYNNQSRYRNQGYYNKGFNQGFRTPHRNQYNNYFPSDNGFDMKFENVPRRRFNNNNSSMQRMKRARSVDDLRSNSNWNHNREINNDWLDAPNVTPSRPIKFAKRRRAPKNTASGSTNLPSISWGPELEDSDENETIMPISNSDEETNPRKVVVNKGHSCKSLICQSMTKFIAYRCFACQCVITTHEDAVRHFKTTYHKESIEKLLTDLTGIDIKNEKDRCEACQKSELHKHVKMEFANKKYGPVKTLMKPRQRENHLSEEDLDFTFC